jgi:hypothetical protein
MGSAGGSRKVLHDGPAFEEYIRKIPSSKIRAGG